MFYTFAEASEKLNISQTKLDKLIKHDIIKNYQLEIHGYKVNIKAYNRILRLEPSLNNYIINNIDEDPTKIIYQHGTLTFSLDKSEVDKLKSNKEKALRLLLEMCKINIDEIKLVIPFEEIKRYKKILSNKINKSINSSLTNDITSTNYNKLNHKTNLPDRSTIKSRSKSPLTLIIEHVLLNHRNGIQVDIDSWDSIANYLNSEVKNNAVLSNGDKVSQHLEKISLKSGRHVTMVDKISGRKHGTLEKNYTASYFRQQFKRIRADFNMK